MNNSHTDNQETGLIYHYLSTGGVICRTSTLIINIIVIVVLYQQKTFDKVGLEPLDQVFRM